MTSSRLKQLHVLHITKNQPFCAGIVLTQQGRLALTLNTDGLPATLDKEQVWRVGGVGGGQEANETIWECATREAREELSCEVQLLSSPTTYFHDIDTGEVYEVPCQDTPAPFLLECQSNFFPYTPYKPGLPTGPYTYFGLFLAQLTDPAAVLQPGDDVVGLLLIEPEQWPLLLQQPTLESMLQHGAQIIERTSTPLSPHKQLWVPPDESFRTVVPLLLKHPELLPG
ncbi:MAG TPA: NUDIX domain-containing protein [Ktedonosporobacter sp.]|nr:NUDIX domain-containing protein [Ktedonosporobacter sp.]